MGVVEQSVAGITSEGGVVHRHQIASPDYEHQVWGEVLQQTVHALKVSYVPLTQILTLFRCYGSPQLLCAIFGPVQEDERQKLHVLVDVQSQR